MANSSSSPVKFISCLSSAVPLVIFGLFALAFFGVGNVFPAVLFSILAVVLASTVGAAVKMNNEWEQAIILRLGKYQRTVGPGLYLIIPFIEQAIVRDIRIRTLDIPRQEVITQDNISVGVDAVVFLKIVDAKKTIINIQDYLYAVRQYAQTTLRNVIGQRQLDELLEKREEIAGSISQAVDVEASNWGIDIAGIELQNIELPENMKRVMARQAEAEREKRAVIIKSQGEVEAAENLKNAANKLMESHGNVAVKLREFETISDISYDQSNTIVFYPSGLGSDTVFSGTALAQNIKYPAEEKKEGSS